MPNQFRTANGAIGNHAALMGMLDTDGYLFFRDVLDRDVLGEVYNRYMRGLHEHGYVADISGGPVWLGTDAKELDDFAGRELHAYDIGEWYVQQPPIKEFYDGLFGDSMEWFPGSGRMTSVYRCTGPSGDSEETDRFIGRHQDGFYNTGLEVYTTWIPLMDIPPEVGGLAIAAGVHKSGILHDISVPPHYPIPREAIPQMAWRTTSYELGDVLIFTGTTPHSALPNRSNKIRLSMDLRIVPSWARAPIVGTVTEASAQRIGVSSERHGSVTVGITKNTTIFGLSRSRLSPSDLATGDDLPLGATVMVGATDGVASVVRPTILPHKKPQQHPGVSS